VTKPTKSNQLRNVDLSMYFIVIQAHLFALHSKETIVKSPVSSYRLIYLLSLEQIQSKEGSEVGQVLPGHRKNSSPFYNSSDAVGERRRSLNPWLHNKLLKWISKSDFLPGIQPIL